jgi:nucleotide-binding universal stress UspA family protein
MRRLSMGSDVQNPGTGIGGMIRRIVVGFDGSKQAQRALIVAVNLAADLRAEVQVLLVVQPPAHTETPAQTAAAAEAERENLSKGLEVIRRQAGGFSEITTHVLIADNPARAIAEQVRLHAFDLVVVGSHGRERVMHGGIGHSVEELLNLEPCPVLVV